MTSTSRCARCTSTWTAAMSCLRVHPDVVKQLKTAGSKWLQEMEEMVWQDDPGQERSQVFTRSSSTSTKQVPVCSRSRRGKRTNLRRIGLGHSAIPFHQTGARFRYPNGELTLLTQVDPNAALLRLTQQLSGTRHRIASQHNNIGAISMHYVISGTHLATVKGVNTRCIRNRSRSWVRVPLGVYAAFGLLLGRIHMSGSCAAALIFRTRRPMFCLRAAEAPGSEPGGCPRHPTAQAARSSGESLLPDALAS